MEYGQLIKDAWRTTWRYRFLWVLGFFAGGAAGLSGFQGNWRGSSREATQTPPEMQAFAASAERWVEANLGLVIAAAIVLVLLGLAFVVVSLIAQGAMAEATADIARGREVTLGSAWRVGLHLFWRYLGMWLILAGAAILAAAVVGAAIALVVAVGAMGGAFSIALAVLLAIAVGLPLIVAAIAAAVAVTIVVAYAQRAIAVEDDGAWSALRDGWRLMRSHVGESLLVWLINVALSVGAGLAVLAALAVAVGILGGIGWAIWSIAGFAGPTIAYGALAGLAILAVICVAAGISNTFFWSYWTLAYLRLTGRAGPQAA